MNRKAINERMIAILDSSGHLNSRNLLFVSMKNVALLFHIKQFLFLFCLFVGRNEWKLLNNYEALIDEGDVYKRQAVTLA